MLLWTSTGIYEQMDALVKHFESRSTNISYPDFGLKPAVFGCLANAIAPLLIAL